MDMDLSAYPALTGGTTYQSVSCFSLLLFSLKWERWLMDMVIGRVLRRIWILLLHPILVARLLEASIGTLGARRVGVEVFHQ